MEPPLVTVVIPTFNDAPEHLRKSVTSALQQSYEPLEIVVVDDGSSSPVTARELGNPRGVEIIRQSNSGPGEARNAGIRSARGEFILPLDGDDWIEPDTVKLLVQALETSDAVAAFPKVRRFGAADGVQDAPPIVRLEDIAVTNQVVACALYRRQVWEDVGGYRTTDIMDEDWFMWLKVLGHTRGTMIQVPDAVLHYRLRPRSRSEGRATQAGSVQRAFVDLRPDLANDLFLAAALEAQVLKSELEDLRAFHNAWSPRVAPLLRLRGQARRLLRAYAAEPRGRRRH
ncbi:glycosyltransferase family A protein [Janibacter limosus]|uniref:Glycosyltransferase family 2 protein n=1 Tax=Janibacter limosus TaxID=53458 RepID=A0A4P6MVG5_9MICO|nr:glycosyltransferase family A protein [Janibacter limosus]QBF45283.1 glycosyltransferase family 2 protein [Janibacter limosus]